MTTSCVANNEEVEQAFGMTQAALCDTLEQMEEANNLQVNRKYAGLRTVYAPTFQHHMLGYAIANRTNNNR